MAAAVGKPPSRAAVPGGAITADPVYTELDEVDLEAVRRAGPGLLATSSARSRGAAGDPDIVVSPELKKSVALATLHEVVPRALFLPAC